MPEQIAKFRIGAYLYKVRMEIGESRIILRFPYSKALIDEVRNMEGAKYHGFDETNPEKCWSIKASFRNWFQIKFLMGENSYADYETPLPTDKIQTHRPLYSYQHETVQHILTRHYCIIAEEMGLGKTLAAIEAAEHSGVKDSDDCWYIGPKGGVYAVNRELLKWESRVKPRMLTYENLIKVMREWKDNFPAPRFVIFDESSKIKTPTAQRSQAAMALAEAVREEYGKNGYVILMSGTPAPKSPLDFWNQCEVACPGFLREGDINKFRRRLSLTKEAENTITGGVFAQHITWLDDERKCAICGQFKEQHGKDIASLVMAPTQDSIITDHEWKQSKNEVQYLYERMKGLVLVKFKKDCLELPEKRYEIIEVTSTPNILRAAKLIAQTGRRAIETLTLLRELSDGFQYQETQTGTNTCPLCKGTGIEKHPIDNTDILCSLCKGEKFVPNYIRSVKEVESPKDQVYIDLLDEYEDIGRCIVWGGFTGTVDRLVKIAKEQGWAVLRVDGRGHEGYSSTGENLDPDKLFNAMDSSYKDFTRLQEEIPRLIYVGQPKAGGIAVTLTAAPVMIYYSNDFSGEARMQSEDRAHRAGMDLNRGLRIIDLIHLPTDKLVLENLKKKRELQNMSMGELQEALV